MSLSLPMMVWWKRQPKAPRGFAGPVDLKLKIYADNDLRDCANMVAGGNAKDLHFKNVNADRDFTVTEYADLRQATVGDACARCGGSLNIRKGIEVGHIFKLGTKYSEALNATYLDQNGKEQLIVMGCYGIGVGRTVAAAIEQNHDKEGIIFPKALAPFHVYLLPISMKDDPVRETTLKLYDDFTSTGIDVLLTTGTSDRASNLKTPISSAFPCASLSAKKPSPKATWKCAIEKRARWSWWE